MSAKARRPAAESERDPPKRTPKPAASRAGRAPTQRQLRVAEEVRHILAGLFTRGEFRDPDLANTPITVTEVRISPDLKNATAFVALLGSRDIGTKLPALRRAAPYLRGQVASAMRLRVAPDISFQPDSALEYATHINELLHKPDVRRDIEAQE